LTMLEKKQESAPNMIVRLIKKDIDSGRLNPGEKLPPQTKMAGNYGVGISSVREAVNTLEVMGILEVIQGSGTYIRKEQPINKSLFDELEADLANASAFELFELRELLECRAAGLAATRADDNSIQKVIDCCDNLVKNASDNQKFIEADRNFHKEISRATGQTAISIIIDLIHHINHSHIKLAQKTLKEEYRIKAVETARQITSHIKSGNELSAVRCMRSHLDIMKQSIS
jgi:GntR family transcriptional repressor for pyruvate dehydrogenase complex